MLTRMRLENFKSWRELELELSNLTFLFGTNSSGKTSILQALLLLKQTAMGFDRDLAMNLGGTEQDYVDFGSYRDLVFGHEPTRRTRIGLSWGRNRGVSPLRPDNEAAQHTYEYSVLWGQIAESLEVLELVYDVDAPESAPIRIKAEYLESERRFQFEYGSVLLNDSATAPLSILNAYSLTTHGQVDPNALPFRFVSDFTYAEVHFESLIKSIAYLGPLRSHPQRTYPFRGAKPTDIGPRGEKTIEWLLSAARDDDKRVQQVADWLKSIGLASEFRIDPIGAEGRFYEPRIRIKPGEVDNSLLDVGFGVSQVLPIVTLLFAAPEGSIVLIEQPELHLHPSAQAGLADLFLEVAEKRKLQLIIESHSEHILARVQRRVAEQINPLATPDHIRMYFCDIENGESKAEPVRLNRFGQVENWPKDFFGDISGDLEKMMESGLARRREELAQHKE